MRIFLSTGEPSGDLHAANLIHSLRKARPGVEVVGFGGPRMAEAGGRVLYPLVDLAVMWILRVLLNIDKFFKLLDDAEAEFVANRPDAVVLIDYPGFHWHLAKRARKHGIPVFYYVPPQIWAWAGWRVEKVKKFVDHVLCSLPFEPAWYRERGFFNAVDVGHPYFDELAERSIDERFVAELSSRPGPLVAILPGSRTQELTRNLPTFLKAASKLAEVRPDVRFAVACLHEKHRELALAMIEEAGSKLDVEVHAARTPELIRVADVAWAVSGSVGLELMVEALPTVVLYKVKAFDLWVARKFIKSKYISLVNLLADAKVMPEYLTAADVSGEIAAHAARWLGDPAERRKASQALAELRDRVAIPGASDRAAGRIIAVLEAPASVNEVTQVIHRGPHEPPRVLSDLENQV